MEVLNKETSMPVGNLLSGSSETNVKEFDVSWLESRLNAFLLGARVETSALFDASELLKSRLRSIVTMAKTFAIHARRSRLTVEDFSSVRGLEGEQEPLGRGQRWNAPISSGLQFPSNDARASSSQFLDVVTYFQTPGVKLPAKAQLKGHWLVIEGVQPCTQDNPTSMERASTFRNQEMSSEARNVQEKAAGFFNGLYCNGSTIYYLPTPLGLTDASTSENFSILDKESVTHLKSLPWLPALAKTLQTSPQKEDRERANESIMGKAAFTKTQLVNHPPASQKVLYQLIISMLNDEDEDEQQEVLQILATNTGLQLLIPRMVVYITEGIRYHISNGMVWQIARVLRIAEAILANRANDLSKLLCDLMPALLSCVLASRLSNDPSDEEHWDIRRFAAKLAVDLCQKHDGTDDLARLTHFLSEQWSNSSNVTLPTLYGALSGLGFLGTETMNELCLPHLSTVEKRIGYILKHSTDEVEIIQARALSRLIADTFGARTS